MKDNMRSIVCDDVREEKGNKNSFMGVYSGEIKVSGKAGAHIPKLCVAILASYEKLADVKDIEVSIKLTQPKMQIKQIVPRQQMLPDISPEKINSDGSLDVTVNFNLSPFPLPNNESSLEIEVYEKDKLLHKRTVPIIRLDAVNTSKSGE